MWKESYRLGVDLIDNQHIELFNMVENLIYNIKNGIKDIKIYSDAIEFMKNYVIKHFKAEEEYQKSINYSDFQSHKKEHEDFIKVINEFEHYIKKSNFNIELIKRFSGTLTAWLIYHVAFTDQKIVGNKTDTKIRNIKNYNDCFMSSAFDVFEIMFNIKIKNKCVTSIEKNKIPGDIFIKIELKEDIDGFVIFGFSNKLAMKIIEIMTLIEMENIDEVVCSALAEITNIISGNACTSLSNIGINCDITPPKSSISYYNYECIKCDMIDIVEVSTEKGNFCFGVIINTNKDNNNLIL